MNPYRDADATHPPVTVHRQRFWILWAGVVGLMMACVVNIRTHHYSLAMFSLVAALKWIVFVVIIRRRDNVDT